MTEVQKVDSTEQMLQGSEAATEKAGQLLRQARERQEMSIETLASALKVPVPKLQALEEDRWQAVGDSVFIRSLALSVCRFLREPIEPVLAGLPKYEAARISSNPEGINAPYKEKSLPSLMTSSQSGGLGMAAKMTVGFFIVVAVVAVGYFHFLPQWSSESVGQAQVDEVIAVHSLTEPAFMPALPAAGVNTTHAEADQQEEIAVAQAQVSAQGGAVAVVQLPLPEQPGAAMPLMTQLPQPIVQQQPDVVAPLAALPPQSEPASAPEKEVSVAPMLPNASAVMPAVDPSQLPADAATLQFNLTQNTWVQVRNAQQRVVIEKVLKAGEVYERTVVGLPLSVVVGNAAAATVEVNGLPFDLAAATKSNVARFEVK